MNNTFWKDKKEILNYTIKWYPHWGAVALSKELNISYSTIRAKMDRLKIKMLPRCERLCYTCKQRTLDINTMFGLRCIECNRDYKTKQWRTKRDSGELKFRIGEMAASAKARNKLTGKIYGITTKFLLEMWEKQEGKCFYTNIEMSPRGKQTTGTKTGFKNPTSLSLDKINPNMGYTENNIVLCCYWANWAKNTLSVEEFIDLCKKVVLNNN